MNHLDPKDIAEHFLSFIERPNRHQFFRGSAELSIVGGFEIRNRKIAKWRGYFDLTTIQSRFVAASGGAA
ncbi:MAG: Limonene,2-epoxide hydrolase catalytic domain [Actinomycetota bacterium]|jgi:limonene-1,2-epoxide hydrolase